MEARDQRAEVRAHPRHRGGRQDHPARHVLPDERQLLLRRLLQGRRHRAGLGAGHRRPGRRLLRLRPGHRLGHACSRTTTRRPGSGARSPACPRSGSSAGGLADNYWHMGVPGPGGPCQRDLHRPRAGARPRRRAGRGRGPVPGDLEPRLHAGGPERGPQQGGLRRARARCRRRTSTPAWASSGWPTCCRASTTSTRSTRSSRSSTGRPPWPASATAANHDDDVRLRVVADHVRSALMLISDGVTPGNEARGYVLRRLLRRTVRSMRLLGYEDPVLPELLPLSRDAMAPSYPELASGFGRISALAYAEEETFRGTLRGGDDDPRPVRPAGPARPGRRGGLGRPGCGGPAEWRAGLPAARHLRLPDRPDPRDGRRAGPLGGRGGLPPPDARAARAGPGGQQGEEVRSRRPVGVPLDRRRRRPHDVHRLRRGGLRRPGPRRPRRRRRRCPRLARDSRSSWSSTARRSTPRAAASSPTRAPSGSATARSSRSTTCRRRCPG